MGWGRWGRAEPLGKVQQSPKGTSSAHLSPQVNKDCTQVPIRVQVSAAVQVAAVQDQHGVLVLLQLGLRVPHGPLEGHLAGQGQAQLLPEVGRGGLHGAGGDEQRWEHHEPSPAPCRALWGSARSSQHQELSQGQGCAGGETGPTGWNAPRLRSQPGPGMAGAAMGEASPRELRLHAGALAGADPGGLLTWVWGPSTSSGLVWLGFYSLIASAPICPLGAAELREQPRSAVGWLTQMGVLGWQWGAAGIGPAQLSPWSLLATAAGSRRRGAASAG